MAHVQAAYFTERDIAEKQRDSFYNPADPWDNGDISFTGGIGKISGVVVGVFIFTALTYSLTVLGIDTNLQFVFSGIIILVAVTLDCLKYVQKK